MQEWRRNEVAAEVIDTPEIVDHAPGPEGPWEWNDLSVRREMNTIIVKGIDGQSFDSFDVRDLDGDNTDDMVDNLKDKLDELKGEALSKL